MPFRGERAKTFSTSWAVTRLDHHREKLEQLVVLARPMWVNRGLVPMEPVAVVMDPQAVPLKDQLAAVLVEHPQQISNN